MLKKLVRKMLSFLKPNRDMAKVLIFGASLGGQNVYRTVRGKFNIIGFVDNNVQLHSSFLFRKKIYSPSEIKNLSYDKILIASDYYKDIFLQLTVDLNIDPDIVNVFNSADTSGNSYFSQLASAANQLVDDYICNINSFRQSKRVFYLLSRISNRYKHIDIKEIKWLDQIVVHKVKIFNHQAQGKSFAPHVVDQEQVVKSVILPEVSLYNFQHAKIMTGVNGVIINKSDIVLSRVPSFPIKDAQYNAAFLTAHGEKNAFIRRFSSTHIDCGIAIIGSNDTNYYHWVIEVLSKLQFLSELPEKYNEFPILISEQALNIESIRFYLKSFCIKRPIIYLKSNIDYKVEDLLFISSANYLVPNLKPGVRSSPEACFVREDSLRYIRDCVLKTIDAKNESVTPLKIFLARKGLIRGYNQAEVIALLEKSGFIAVYLEDFDLPQQVRLMQGAEVIIGPTGAAWTNLIFCQPGTLALCWMADEAGDLSCFSNLAQCFQVKMNYLKYKTDKKNSRDLYFASYSIELDLISKWLKKNNL